MIQDIYPSKLDNSFRNLVPDNQDYLLFFDGEGRLLTRIEDGCLSFTEAYETSDAVYLFSLDDKRYFLSLKKYECLQEEYEFRSLRELRDKCSGKEVFAAFTAYHLWKWYSDNKYCGKCGGYLTHATTERALYCSNCGNRIYPRINPAVIVGVMKGDSLLITR